MTLLVYTINALATDRLLAGKLMQHCTTEEVCSKNQNPKTVKPQILFKQPQTQKSGHALSAITFFDDLLMVTYSFHRWYAGQRSFLISLLRQAGSSSFHDTRSHTGIFQMSDPVCNFQQENNIVEPRFQLMGNEHKLQRAFSSPKVNSETTHTHTMPYSASSSACHRKHADQTSTRYRTNPNDEAILNPSSEFDANMIDIPMLAYTLMQSRQTVLPKRLVEPGPNTAQLEELFKAAATAPDHGLQRPWRFVLVPTCARHLLAETFATALLQRDATASIEAVEQARDKAYRAPVLMLVVVHTGGENPRIPLNERLTSAGCALQNILLTATAQGFGSALTSGDTLQSAPLRELFSLKTDELALYFLSVGTASSRKPIPPRPAPCDFVNILGDTDTPIPQHFLVSTSVCNETLDQRLLRSEKT